MRSAYVLLILALVGACYAAIDNGGMQACLDEQASLVFCTAQGYK